MHLQFECYAVWFVNEHAMHDMFQCLALHLQNLRLSRSLKMWVSSIFLKQKFSVSIFFFYTNIAWIINVKFICIIYIV